MRTRGADLRSAGLLGDCVGVAAVDGRLLMGGCRWAAKDTCKVWIYGDRHIRHLEGRI